MIQGAVHLSYVAAFSVAAVVCLAVGWRMRASPDDAVGRGLVALFVTSGVWAVLTVGQLLSPSLSLKVLFYLSGLVVGFATVGCWLYFVAAYTGSTLHRDPVVRAVAVAVFGVVTLVKVTNVVHGQYVSYTLGTDPFVHLSLVRYWPHWVVTGVAYTLTGVGFVHLFRTYRASGHDRSPLAMLATVSAVPVVPDVVSTLRPDLLLTVTYEPVGVAVFAIGAFLVVESGTRRLGRPARAQLVEELRDPVVVVDTAGTVRDFNAAAATLFERTDHPLVVGGSPPRVVEDAHDAGDDPVGIGVDGETRHYLVSRSSVEFGPHRLGWAQVFTDVTRLVAQRREIERQQRTMDDIAEATAHELRNGLNVAAGYADLCARRGGDGTDPDEAAVDALNRGHTRMRRVVDDLTSLATLARTAHDVEPQRMSDAVAAARHRLDGRTLAVGVDVDGDVVAEPARLTELLSKLFEHADERGATTATVSVTADGFVLRHDGQPLDNAADALKHGTAAVDGIGLANAGALARAHGWRLSFSTVDTGEVTIAATGADTTPLSDLHE